jgi:hypothetical protein
VANTEVPNTEDENPGLLRGFGSFDEVTAATAATAAQLSVVKASTSNAAGTEKGVGRVLTQATEKADSAASAGVVGGAARDGKGDEQQVAVAGDANDQGIKQEQGTLESVPEEKEQQQQQQVVPEVPPLRLQGKLLAEPSEEDVLQVRGAGKGLGCAT